MYIIDLVKLRNILANRSFDYRDGGDGKTADIFNRIEMALTSSALRQSLESVIDDRAREIVAKALESIIKYCDSRDHSDIHVTRYALEYAIRGMKGEQGQCTTPNDGPLASPVTAANDADPDAMRIVRIERIANTIIDYSEASCIDETDPDDPMAKIVRDAREVMRRPAPVRREAIPIHPCVMCGNAPRYIEASSVICGCESRAGEEKRSYREWNDANPRATEPVKLNPCRECGLHPKFSKGSASYYCPDGLCNENANDGTMKTPEDWNAANPLPAPVSPDRRFKPGQRFIDGDGFEFELRVIPGLVKSSARDKESNRAFIASEDFSASELGIEGWTPID